MYEAERNRAWHSWFAARGDVSPSDEHTRIFDGGFRMAWELCRAQPAPGAWIPVSERLPERSCEALCVRAGYRTPVVTLDDYCHETRSFGWSDITHWQPLPEPPKGDNHE